MKRLKRQTITLFLLTAALLVLALLAMAHEAKAQGGSPLHPTFPLLDANGNNVLDSGEPVSTMKTCGSCHDTAFIAQHSFHSDAGLSDLGAAGSIAGGRPWDTSPGLFGRWDPLTYRYLSPEGDTRIDLTLAEWIQVFGARHAGGGPALVSPDGTLLTDPSGDPNALRNQIVDPATGELVPWDWQASGVVEMNCFLCHFAAPNNDARIAALQAGEFGWANTATLSGTGIVDQVDGQWVWNPAAFDENGNLKPEMITVQDPTNANCGQCHGAVHIDHRTPLVLDQCDSAGWTTTTTGQVFSPQRLSESGLNLQHKEELTRSWDVHSERVVSCTDCHYALNNPVYYEESDGERPEHLAFDPRRVDLGEYLYRPMHDFATGQSAQSLLSPEHENTMRRCESCHDTGPAHDWLPYSERHMSALACETCHVPQLYAPARQTTDWTVLRLNGSARVDCRGVSDSGDPALPLIAGYRPVLLPRDNGDGTITLAPHNLIASWYWVYGKDEERPVPLRDLQAVWLDGDSYQADVLAAFDSDGDGALSDAELVIDTDEKEALIASKLEARGLENPRIVGEVRPYSINHDVVGGEWAIKDCQTCHSDDSRVNAGMRLADRVPGGVVPVIVSDSSLVMNGELAINDRGELYYQPKNSSGDGDLYIFGHDRVSWIDALGAVLFLGTVAAISGHSGLRYITARRRIPHDPAVKRVYMYSVYERQWHWLQTAAILLLILTGLIIHKPNIFGFLSFRYVVQVHNVLALILLINAGLAAFYHFASGEIRHYLPKPHGFFDQAFAQARYYLHGIFRGEPHPFQKSADQKMNPLQQITYLMILNVLLPLQIITGILMWGAQTWPDAAARLGGLDFLAPLHTISAWLFAAFIVGHVYLTTTERTPLTGIKAMITGWSELDEHSSEED